MGAITTNSVAAIDGAFVFVIAGLVVRVTGTRVAQTEIYGAEIAIFAIFRCMVACVVFAFVDSTVVSVGATLIGAAFTWCAARCRDVLTSVGNEVTAVLCTGLPVTTVGKGLIAIPCDWIAEVIRTGLAIVAGQGVVRASAISTTIDRADIAIVAVEIFLITVAFDGIAKVYRTDVSIVAGQGCIGASGAWEACVRSTDISVITVKGREETFAKQGIALFDRAWVTVGAIDGYIATFIAFNQDSTFCDIDGDHTEVDCAFVRIFASLEEGRALSCQTLAFVDGAGVVVVADRRLVLTMSAVTGVLRALATVIAIRIAVTE